MTAAELNGRATVPVKCGSCGWDAEGDLTLVDRWETDYPPVPYRGPMVEVYENWDDPESRIIECDHCGAYLDLKACVERVAA